MPSRSRVGTERSEASALRVLVVVESTLWRQLLVEFLAREPHLRILRAVDTIGDGVRALTACGPADVVILDMQLPASLAAVQDLLRAQPDVGIVGLGQDGSDRRVATVLQAGLRGYVAKEGGVADLLHTISVVSAGGAVCSTQVAAQLLHRLRARMPVTSPDNSLQTLTPREAEVLQLIQEGCSNREIAERLGIEVPTAKNHVHRILVKLGVTRRTQAARHQVSI